MRASRSRLTFPHPFILSGYADELPPGTYDVIVEEERLEGRGFIAYRRTATYLAIAWHGLRKARHEIRRITEADLAAALAPDRACLGPARRMGARAVSTAPRSSAEPAG